MVHRQGTQADGWGLSIDDRTRIFHLRLNNIPSAEWPVAFSGARGYQCYEEGPGRQDRPAPVTWTRVSSEP